MFGQARGPFDSAVVHVCLSPKNHASTCPLLSFRLGSFLAGCACRRCVASFPVHPIWPPLRLLAQQHPYRPRYRAMATSYSLPYMRNRDPASAADLAHLIVTLLLFLLDNFEEIPRNWLGLPPPNQKYQSCILYCIVLYIQYKQRPESFRAATHKRQDDDFLLPRPTQPAIGRCLESSFLCPVQNQRKRNRSRPTNLGSTYHSTVFSSQHPADASGFTQ